MKPDMLDYSYLWWPEGWRGKQREVYIRTGHYGLVLNTVTGMPARAGVLPPASAEQAHKEGNGPLNNLPLFTCTPALRVEGKLHAYLGIEAAEKNANPDGTPFPNDGANPSRILASGRVRQRCDMMFLRFEGLPALAGRLEADCSPRHFGLILDAYNDVPLTFSPVLTLHFEKSARIVKQGRAVLVQGETGGFCLLAPENATVTVGEAEVTFEGAPVHAPGALSLAIEKAKIALLKEVEGGARTEDRFAGFGITVLPTENTKADASYLQALAGVKVSARELSPGSGMRAVTYQQPAGGFTVDLSGMFTVSGADFEKENHLSGMDELLLTLENPFDFPVQVPLQFYKPYPFSVTGFCPMLRDAKTKEPIGLPVQLTKNWHGYSVEPNGVWDNVPADNPRRHYEGVWYRGYTAITLPPNSKTEVLYTCPFATWGGVYTSSHSQLCLAGWGGGQQWETCSVGSFGESFCYDIARSWTWCCMGDICPLGVYSRVDGKKYDWTGNIGGGDFLVFYGKDGRKIQHARVRTYFRTQGPNLSEVVYTGLSEDGAVYYEITAFLPRTNDVSHALHRVKMVYVKDADYARTGLYQFGADSYNYDYWQRMAVGNNEGVVPVSMLGAPAKEEFQVPISESNETVWGPEFVPGEGLWAGYAGAERGKAYGNKVMAVHSFNACIGGETYTKPRLSVRTTNVLQWKGAIFELNLPVDGPIPAGSTVEFTADYINLPIIKSDYYGGSPGILNLPEDYFDSWRILHAYAVGLNTRVTAQLGEVVENLPPKIRALGSQGEVARFTISGGRGYVPVTVANVPGYSGWRLEMRAEEGWQAVEQSVHGNDYWQCLYVPAAQSYELTYNVPAQEAPATYRLVKVEGAEG